MFECWEEKHKELRGEKNSLMLVAYITAGEQADAQQ